LTEYSEGAVLNNRKAPPREGRSIMLAATTFVLRSAKGENMTDTGPQREGETLKRKYRDPSVLGGEVGLWIGSSALNPMPAAQAKEAAAEV